ncbi:MULTISPECIES: LacI family DNA-binding transcriptional regulator [unclassified Oceanispirochaeta]|uniref:LacI family DNA-binding transcriptional regulator n=1 Tax=unclassified Oceanispirochaeta TaxID=2635722 RepID=UPI000E0943E9|nr:MULTISPECIES: LacI family DNA-binding transcriptional regulator [unclassified Oceanispirochaeta]MBF9016213.1 LacI family DNA-binding transcriptional regulator [Oceanispirochaeta sp. M2]NPD72675.1 LacI family transcriptional regulator [Oceanispirochaeta sp. M1]RDG31825.1 LacI family transcriptional regulator [Oceanispirochaeta sp. M1]
MAEKNNRDKVAALAGVSSATVSRVYNNPDRVSSAKKEAVLNAARELAYSPDKSASALRRRGTGQISLVSFEKQGRPWYWGDFPGAKWFFTDVLTGVLSVIDSSMYRLNLKTLKSAEDVRSVNWKQECDGVIFFDVDSEEEAAAVAGLPIPSVISHHTSHFENNHCCSTDNSEGGRLAAVHLKEAGYDRPSYISYLPEIIIPNRERYGGFCKGFDAEVPLHLTEPGKEGGYKICEKLLTDISAGRIDSLAVVNDMTAIGIIQCLQDNGLRPGKDLGLIGYDNMPFNYALPFSLSTVDLKPSLIYKEAVSMLLELLGSSEKPDIFRKKIILPEVIRGESV